jgi:hypothetical protein
MQKLKLQKQIISHDGRTRNVIIIAIKALSTPQFLAVIPGSSCSIAKSLTGTDRRFRRPNPRWKAENCRPVSPVCELNFLASVFIACRLVPARTYW